MSIKTAHALYRDNGPLRFGVNGVKDFFGPAEKRQKTNETDSAKSTKVQDHLHESSPIQDPLKLT